MDCYELGCDKCNNAFFYSGKYSEPCEEYWKECPFEHPCGRFKRRNLKKKKCDVDVLLKFIEGSGLMDELDKYLLDTKPNL